MAILSLDKNVFASGKNQPDFQYIGAEPEQRPSTSLPKRFDS